eukprot:CAMPEP_0119138702 /NCGR_PEP_ID=MMETSP1310-20130426/26160_1 /TAXON_ID=464262 /ORGANISM="Genus nov. species nov., Strain RCC2339" /LENGTH=34 /DNA_ID= /DNA_START= /DNA_END= /DNA_ORIENTATION=
MLLAAPRAALGTALVPGTGAAVAAAAAAAATVAA